MALARQAHEAQELIAGLRNSNPFLEEFKSPLADLGLEHRSTLREAIESATKAIRPWEEVNSGIGDLIAGRDTLLEQAKRLNFAEDRATRIFREIGQRHETISEALRATAGIQTLAGTDSLTELARSALETRAGIDDALKAFSLTDEFGSLNKAAELIGENSFAREAKRILESNEALEAARLMRDGVLPDRFAEHVEMFEAEIEDIPDGWTGLSKRLTDIGEKLGPLAQAFFVNLVLKKYLLTLIVVFLAHGSKHELCEKYGHLFPEYFEACGDAKAKLRDVNVNLVLNFNQQDLVDWRIVSVKSQLNVRADGTMKANVIDYLYPGAIVYLLMTSENRDWAFIEYRDPFTHEIETGWVNARYLKKVNFRPRYRGNRDNQTRHN